MHEARTHDTLHRRRRDRPLSTDKRVTPQPRDLLWFQKLHEHGPLSSTYLHEFSKHLARNEKRSRDRLTDLFNESRTPHGGPYLVRPPQQFQTLDARYQDLVYDLSPAAELALKDNGLWHDCGASPGGPWRHRYMVACITASIELGTIDDPNLTYIPQHAILSRAKTKLRYPVPFRNPTTGKEEKCDLIPDAIFGLEYRHTGVSGFRFFVLEADRGTEPSRAGSFNRKSHLRNLLQYREYIGSTIYKQHLALTAPLLVLNVTNHITIMERMIALAHDSLPNNLAYYLYQHGTQIGLRSKSSRPTNELLRNNWLRSGFPALSISSPTE